MPQAIEDFYSDFLPIALCHKGGRTKAISEMKVTLVVSPNTQQSADVGELLFNLVELLVQWLAESTEKEEE